MTISKAELFIKIIDCFKTKAEIIMVATDKELYYIKRENNFRGIKGYTCEKLLGTKIYEKIDDIVNDLYIQLSIKDVKILGYYT